MPFLAASAYGWSVARRDIHPSLKRRYAGSAAMLTLTAALIEIWMVRCPPDVPLARFGSETAGVVSVWLMSCSLILATRWRRLEPWFGGLDRMYLWHRRTAAMGALLIPVHLGLYALGSLTNETSLAVPSGQLGNALGAASLLGITILVLLAFAPRVRFLAGRLEYQRWFVSHRFIGIFVIAAVVHGLLVDPILREDTVLRVLFAAIGSLGGLAYIQRELIARWRHTDSSYTAATVTRLDASTLDVTLQPVGAPLSFQAGQFVFVAFEGVGGSESHPYTVASASSDSTLRLSIRSRGDYTAELYRDLQPGVPVRVSGPYGMFDHEVGGRRQIWIAGGIGVTPFLSWLRGSPLHADREVRFYYTVPTQSAGQFAAELTAAAESRDWLRFTPVHSDVDGRLTVERIVADCGGTVTGFDVFMCGPAAMIHTFRDEFRRRGLGPDAIHFEHFSFR